MTIERPKEVTAYHLAGWAGVYFRQSTLKQVQENVGSSMFQHNQARWAKDWGWAEQDIKEYDDPGLSGSAIEHRPSYLRMVADIRAKKLRAVFAGDQSRFIRKTPIWIQFLDLCRMNNVLVVLGGRILRLGDDGDEFASCVIALIDEQDNRRRRATFQRGIMGKVQSGRAVTGPPTGFVSRKDGGWDLDPDNNVQLAISEVFRIFQLERSCPRTVRRLVAEGKRIPRRRPGKHIVWASPSIGAVASILKNPAYMGAYVFRQRVCDESRGRNRRGHFRVRKARPDERIEIPGHHAAYIAPDAWAEIQAILHRNAPTPSKRNLGPGRALLQGAIGCGRHRERAMTVDYKEASANGTPGAFFYHCLGDFEVGGPQCGVVSGYRLDAAVAAAIFERLEIPRLETIRLEWQAAILGEKRANHARNVALDDARRRVDDLKARYLAVSVNLRDLAEDIEIDLNQAIRERKRLEGLAADDHLDHTLFTQETFDELLHLCEDLPSLFHAVTTTSRDRKEICRIMVDRVIVTGASHEAVHAEIRWSDGSDPTQIEVRLAGYAHRVIRELHEQGLGTKAIVHRLGELNIPTSRGKVWNATTVWQAINYTMRLPRHHKSRPQEPRLAADKADVQQIRPKRTA